MPSTTSATSAATRRPTAGSPAGARCSAPTACYRLTAADLEVVRDARHPHRRRPAHPRPSSTSGAASRSTTTRSPSTTCRSSTCTWDPATSIADRSRQPTSCSTMYLEMLDQGEARLAEALQILALPGRPAGGVPLRGGQGPHRHPGRAASCRRSACPTTTSWPTTPSPARPWTASGPGSSRHNPAWHGRLDAAAVGLHGRRARRRWPACCRSSATCTARRGSTSGHRRAVGRARHARGRPARRIPAGALGSPDGSRSRTRSPGDRILDMNGRWHRRGSDPELRCRPWLPGSDPRSATPGLSFSTTPMLRQRRERLLARAEGDVARPRRPDTAWPTLAARPDASVDTVISVLHAVLGARRARHPRATCAACCGPAAASCSSSTSPTGRGPAAPLDLVGAGLAAAWARLRPHAATSPTSVRRARLRADRDLDRFTVPTLAVPLRRCVAGRAVLADGTRRSSHERHAGPRRRRRVPARLHLRPRPARRRRHRRRAGAADRRRLRAPRAGRRGGAGLVRRPGRHGRGPRWCSAGPTPSSPEHVEAVRASRFTYLAGGSPMHLRSVLKDTPAVGGAGGGPGRRRRPRRARRRARWCCPTRWSTPAAARSRSGSAWCRRWPSCPRSSSGRPTGSTARSTWPTNDPQLTVLTLETASAAIRGARRVAGRPTAG